VNYSAKKELRSYNILFVILAVYRDILNLRIELIFTLPLPRRFGLEFGP